MRSTISALIFNLAVLLTANSQTIIFCDDFESGTFGTDWIATPGTPNGVVSINTAIGNPGRGVRMGKSNAGGFATNKLDLVLKLGAYINSDVSMTFEIEDRSDETHIEDGLYFSNNGGVTFEKVFDFNPSVWCDDNYGSFPPFDIDSLAAAKGLSLTDNFVIRFQQYGDNTLPNNDGFYLDNVCVFVQPITYVNVFPFNDNFDIGTLGSHWTKSFPYQTILLPQDPNRPNNILDIASIIGVGGSRAIRMGKECADGPSTNALDLHLDLSGNSDYALTFNIQDRSDDTDVDDGLYFSDNGGISFEKVFDFNPSFWCDDDYGTFPPFDIDSLAASKGLSLSSRFVIRFQQHGDNTLPSNDGFYLDNVSVFVPTLTYVNIFPFTDNFDMGTFDSHWTKSFPYQTILIPHDPNRPNNIIDIASIIGVGGTRAVRMGKECADGPSTNALDLHLDLSGNSDYALTFNIQDRSDDTNVDDGLYFSDNGGISFEKVFDFNPSLWCDDDYGIFPPFDIDSLAASKGLSLSSRFVIRFQQHGDNTLPSNDGFYLDNVSVFVPTLTYVNIFPFIDNFDIGTFDSHWTKSFPYQTILIPQDPNRPNNIIDIANGIGIGNSRAVRMGKECADGPSTNALDLHLDLSGNSDYALTFNIQDRSDDTDVDDGLYFSDNGGVSFEKVFDFNPSLWCDDNYGIFPPFDIDSLAASKGLSLSSRFVIRFQQHGDNTLPNNDGFYLDNVSVFVPTLTYVNIFPFTDNFDMGTFDSYWTKSFPYQTILIPQDPNRPNNIIDIANGIGIGNSRAVRMGKECADGPSTNALDLHLNLSGLGQASLNFKLQDRSDDTDVDDGLFFSDNAGGSFKKVFDFDFGNTPNSFIDYSIDIDSLAVSNGLNLSSKFVVRFQQHGDNILPNNDGIYLDNINITGIVGTEEVNLFRGFKVYPNPTREVLNVEVSEFFRLDEYRFEIRNLMGELIVRKEVISTEESVNISSLPNGMYIVELIGEEGRTTRKFLKI